MRRKYRTTTSSTYIKRMKHGGWIFLSIFIQPFLQRRSLTQIIGFLLKQNQLRKSNGKLFGIRTK